MKQCKTQIHTNMLHPFCFTQNGLDYIRTSIFIVFEREKSLVDLRKLK